MKFVVIPCTVLLIMLGRACSIQAQQATLSGTVVNRQAEPVGDAHVLLNGVNQYRTVTGPGGTFKIIVPEPGTYRLQVSSVGYLTYTKTLALSEELNERRIQLRERIYQNPTMVVTATRTRRDLEEVPQPVTVISAKEIETSGSTRLSDVLAEQTGLTLTSDHGTGIQVQGFSADYTKILIDGQPLIGRTAGTLNLERISVGNVQQIEMVKGPSSALWGSDALAGVINIITEKGREPFALEAGTRYASNRTVDLHAAATANWGSWQNNLFLNRNSSRGYSLVPGALSQTVPPYHSYTASYQTAVPVSGALELSFRGRYYREEQSSTEYVGEAADRTLLDGEAVQEDYSLAPTLNFDLAPGIDGEISHYYSRYRTDTRYRYRQGDSLYSRSAFDQHLNKSELQLNRRWSPKHVTTAGGGFVNEQLRGERYPSTPAFNSYFLFGQHEWRPATKLAVIAGFRYDGHSEYASQLSPKFSARYKITDWLHLRGSAGSGFKAPDFRQLFLDFTNPTVGYTVVGSSNAVQRIRELQAQGQVQQVLMPLDQLRTIRAEQSWAYNAGVDLFPAADLELRLNVFHNDVEDLIESAPVATKTNGQSIYTYFNLREVYTRGLEAQLRWKPLEQLEISGGYQWLDARRKIEGTRTVQNAEGEVVEEEYAYFKPLFNRSRHSANIKAYFAWEALDMDANIRGNWHGKYGRVDVNGNGFVNEGEYEDGYTIWDASLSKTFKEDYTLRAGVDNIFNFTRPSGLSYLPGRIYYAQLTLQLY